MTYSVTAVHFYSHSTIAICLCRTAALKFQFNFWIFVTVAIGIDDEPEIFNYILKFIIQFSVSKTRNSYSYIDYRGRLSGAFLP